MYYVGVDYHKDLATVCVMTPGGNVKDLFEVRATPAGMDEMLERIGRRRFKVLGEAFTYAIDLHNHLITRGVDSTLVKPTDLKLITKSSKKTDPNDATNLARYLLMNDKGMIALNASNILGGEEFAKRAITRLRENTAAYQGVLTRRVGAHMRMAGEYLPQGYEPKIAVKRNRDKLIELFPDDPVLMDLICQYVYLDSRCDVLDKALDGMDFDPEDLRLLETIPGVGHLTACELMSIIVDIGRFPSADAMRAYYGMAPNVRDSGGQEHHGHITKHGDPMMRQILVRVVMNHHRFCPGSRVSRYYDKHSGTGTKNAAMHAANKLLDIIYAMLRDRTEFRA